MALQNTARAKQQSRNTLIIVIVLVLLVLGGAAFFLLGGKAKPEQPQRAAPPPGTIAVPVLSRDIKIGGRIARNKLSLTFMKPEEIPSDALLSPKQFVGRFAARELTAGDYIKEADITAQGAHSGFSGVARLGKRVIAIPDSIFLDAAAIRVGDRLDLLSIGSPTGATNAAPAKREKTAIEKARGGCGPGQSCRPPPQATGNNNRANVNSTTATLIAENVEVLAIGNGLAILQMEPQDAHVASLAIASGATIRSVFRPFNDDTRLTQAPDVKVTTRLPRPSLDPDTITVFNGTERDTERAVSNLYRNDSENSNRFSTSPDNEENSVEPLIQNIN